MNRVRTARPARNMCVADNPATQTGGYKKRRARRSCAGASSLLVQSASREEPTSRRYRGGERLLEARNLEDGDARLGTGIL